MNIRHGLNSATLWLVIILWCCWPFPALAQSLPASERPVSNRFGDIEEFADQFFAPYIGSKIPGLAFVVVQDGKPILSKGYGYADLEKLILVDPEKTVFRLGSLSKVITVAGVLQLVDSGQLDLEQPVDTYVDHLPLKNDRFPPIRLKHLLTHTHGIDMAWIVEGANQCERPLPTLETFLRERLPERILPPGNSFMYGGTGMAIAGHLLEVVSNMPFPEYINQKILMPLDMTSSSFEQPLPEKIQPNLAIGYQYKQGQFIPNPFLCNKSIATVGFSSTPADMAKFMMAQLQVQDSEETPAFSEAVLEKMHQTQFTNFPDFNRAEGFTYGLFERYQNGHWAVEHGGSMYGFFSHLYLMPEENLGWFLIYNTNNLEVVLREQFIEEFLNKYFPDQDPPAPAALATPSSEFQNLFSKLDGSYRFIRYPHRSISKLGAILLGSAKELQVQAKSDGKVTLIPENTEWVEVKPLLFHLPETDRYLRFMVGENNEIEAIALNDLVSQVFAKIPWYTTRKFHITIIAIWNLMYMAICGSGLLFWFRSRKKPRYQSSKIDRLTQKLMSTVSVGNVIFSLLLISLIIIINPWTYFIKFPTSFFLLLHLPALTITLAALTIILGSIVLVKSHWNRRKLFQFIWFNIASLLFFYSMSFLNILGFQLY